jgi:hypothetical protein
MPKLDLTKKFQDVFLQSPDKCAGSSGASTVFITMHQLFPLAEWRQDVPALTAKGLAGWWDTQFSALSKLSDAAVKAAAPSRDRIVNYLKDISSQKEGWKDSATNLANELSRLVTTISKDMPTRAQDQNPNTPWASFQDASASLLIRVSAGLQAGDTKDRDGTRLGRIEAALKLAEETQRLEEIVGEPPSDLKWNKMHETSADYLKALPSTTGPAQKFIQQILDTLQNDKRDQKGNINPDYLTSLADEVRQVRQTLISDMANNKLDPDLARCSILIGEALTPDYTSNNTVVRPTPRSPFTAGQLKSVDACVNQDFKDRLKDAVEEEKGDGEIL